MLDEETLNTIREEVSCRVMASEGVRAALGENGDSHASQVEGATMALHGVLDYIDSLGRKRADTYSLPDVETFGTDDVTFLANKLVEEAAELMVRLKEARDSGTIGNWDRILAEPVKHEVGDVVCTLANLLAAMDMPEGVVASATFQCRNRYLVRESVRKDGE